MKTTLDQWEVLETLGQVGSYAAAAAKLNRSQSTISYAISRLQEQFTVPMFEANGRRSQLTDAGRSLLADAGPLLSGFRALEQRGASLLYTSDTQINLSVDSLYPSERLFSALAQFTRAYRYVRPQIRSAPFVLPSYEFAHSGAHLCITGMPSRDSNSTPLMDVQLRAVARADHPLHNQGTSVGRAALLQHAVVIIQRAHGSEIKRQPCGPSQRYLAADTIESAVEAVRSGMYFGWLPVHRIAAELASGELLPLQLATGAERTVRLFLVTADAEADTRETNLLRYYLLRDSQLTT